MKAALLVAVMITTVSAETEADTSRGPQILKAQNCIQCHTVGADDANKGSAPSLGRSLNREYSSAGLVSAMWNHGPTMWSAMKQANIAKPKLNDKDSADLMAYFASLRFFEPAGDAARGVKLVQSKNCVQCHAVAGVGSGVARPMHQWDSVSDPVSLVQRMWNHAPQMRKAQADRRFKWQSLSAQDLSDILVYVRSLPGRKAEPAYFGMPPVETGASLLEANGCTTCHKGALSLDTRTVNRSLTEIAAAMYNHAPKMLQNPGGMSGEEMRKVVGHLWGKQFLHPAGDQDRGRQLFMTAKCDTCHGLEGAPKLTGRVSTVRMVSAIWEHGEEMQSKIKSNKGSWPTLNEKQMSDLIAYLDWRATDGKPAK
jgi:mono/diheme cytochrome c family protein